MAHEVLDFGAIGRRVRQASHAWADAGLGRRLGIVQEASRRLRAGVSGLCDAAVREGASRRLAAQQVERVCHVLHPDRLEWQARNLVRLVQGPWGREILAYRPDGVVLLVAPGNSPFSGIAPAFYVLLVGNGVIVRAPQRSLLLEAIAGTLRDVLTEHGYGDLVTVLSGSSREILGKLLPAPEVDTVVFFGNSVAGRDVAASAARNGKKLILELEGGDNLLVWKDAALDAALDSAMRVWDASTQFCILPKHLLVHGAVYDRFLAEFVRRTATSVRTVVADPVDGVLSTVAKVAEFDSFLRDALRVGKLECGGHRMAPDGTPDPSGPFVAATIVSMNAAALRLGGLRCFEDEVAFPLVPVVRFDGSDEEVERAMFDAVRASPFGLRCSLWTKDTGLIERFVRTITDVGMLRVNEDHITPPALGLAWGGPKRSGGPMGENMQWAARTGRLQVVTCKNMTEPELQASLDGLGYLGPSDGP